MEAEIVSISSDSDDTIIETEEKDKSSQLLPETHDDLRYLFQKYLGSKKCETNEQTDENAFNFNTKPTDECNVNKKKHSSYFSDDEDIDLPGCSNYKKYKFESLETPNTEPFSIPEKHCVISPKNTKEQQKLEKERLRQEKLKLKEQKKEEDSRNKAIKEALNKHYKNMKPENCIKFIKVQIDQTLVNEDFYKFVSQELEKNGVSYVTISQEVPSVISWKQQLDSHILDSNGQLIDASDGVQTDEALVFIKWDDFLNHILNETFDSHIENICLKLKGKRILLIIVGLEQYYQYQKRQKNREFKQGVLNNEPKTYKDQKKFGNFPVVSRRKIEYVLTEIQLIYSVSHRMIENGQDLATLIFQMTKSIAQIPYKREKQEKFAQARWFMSEDKKNCVRVDKNGNGLSKLWKQVIKTFPLASLETAEAVAAVYPTPSSLFEAYDKVDSKSEGEKLLQDIPIRRAAGPITTMRKIGPELSRKIYNSFTSVDPNKFL